MKKRTLIKKLATVSLLLIFTMLISLATANLGEGTKNQKNIFGESQIAENVPSNNQEPLWGVSGILVHIQEIFGTVDNPQYRPLEGVKVKIRSKLFEDYGFYLITLSSGETDEYGHYGIAWQGPWFKAGLSNKVIISKEGYHTYKCKPYQTFKTPGCYFQDVYFTIAKDDSPFSKQCPKSYP